MDTIPTRTSMADEQRATIAAAYAVYSAKKRAEGCGGDTKIVSIQPRTGLSVAIPASILTLEDCFRRYDVLRENTTSFMFGMPPLLPGGKWVSPQVIAKEISDLMEEISGIEIYHQIRP